MSSDGGSDVPIYDGEEEGVEVLTIMGEHLINSILEEDSLDAIKGLVSSGSPIWYQNVDEGISALHAAVYVQNTELVRYLIEEGAVWNAVDNLKNTAGDIALSFNNEEIYTIIRDAGIRAELLLALLSSKTSSEPPSTLVLRSTDATATGSNDAFLSSKLIFKEDKQGQKVCMVTVGEEEVGVMMGWEQEIMESTAKKLCQNHENADNFKVLNIGFGLGMIDSLFQSLGVPPTTHVIIEPHPDVLKYMKDLGWYEKKGVRILEGRWQDFVTSDDILGVGGFDVIYTDPFSEDYSDLHGFFEHLPDLLAGPESRFSFFNGLGATNALFYDVYTHISELHLTDVGVDVEWSDVSVSYDDNEDRWGKSREYFTLPLYRLPIGRMSAI